MIVCGDVLNRNVSEKLAERLSIPLVYPEIIEFPDGEKKVTIPKDILGEDVVLLKFFPSSIDSEILLTSFIIDALVRSGSASIKGVMPYFPYIRSDHQEMSREAVNVEVVARLFETSGLTSLITFDPHTVRFPEFFTIPVTILSAKNLFAKEIGAVLKNAPFSLVSPDSGGERMIRPLSEIFHHSHIVTVIKKRDKKGTVQAESVTGTVEKICVIVDDIIATGGTIREAIRILKSKGAREFYIFATHGVLTKTAGVNMSDPSVKHVYITDTIPGRKINGVTIPVVDTIAGLFENKNNT